ncbi:MAG: hypothetical protein HPY57_13930 [Ignavibacteria bacterium]|nr:hypothetical protein [Ignavibacteria bacterium]
MSRIKGIASFSANFEPQIAAPLDARSVVGTKADLTNASIWLANDGTNYTYPGMVVTVYNDYTPSNNGVYYLAALPYSNPANWVQLVQNVTDLSAYWTSAQTVAVLTSYSPTGHTHVWSDITNTAHTHSQYSLTSHTHNFYDLSNTAHTHLLSDIQGAAISGLSDVNLISLVSGQTIIWDGSYWINSSTVGESVLTENVTSMLSVGGISSQTLLPSGTTFTDFVKELLTTTFYPTLNAPTFSLTTNQSANLESGSEPLIAFTYNFSRGSILGNLVGGIWDPNAWQNYRIGDATNCIINGITTTVNTPTLQTYTIIDGPNTYSGSCTFSTGVQPIDSNSQPYNSPYPGATEVRTVTITGKRKAFYGNSNSGTTSTLIRALSGSILGPVNGSTFTINIPSGAWNVVFAYPSTLQNVTSVKYVEGLNAEIKDIFTQTTVSVQGANGYSAINYKVYIYTPVEPFSTTATYNVTI